MATLIVNDLTPRASYTVSTVPQSQFTVNFPFFQAEDLTVLKTVNEVTTQLALENDFTVTGAGTSTGGFVNMRVPVTNCRITIKRNMALKRVTDFPLVGPFNIEALNDDIDKLVMLLQQVNSGLRRTIRMADEDPFAGLELPAPSVRANKALVFGPAGEATISTDNFSDVVQQAQSALAQSLQLKTQIDQALAAANALLQQAQSANLLPEATVGDAGKPVVVIGEDQYGLGNAAADKDLANVSNGDFANKAAAAGVGGSGGFGSPTLVDALYGGSF